MLDVYFSPDINLSELKKDENVTITENEIIINCYGKKHSAAIGETWRSRDKNKVFHLYGWNMAVYYYLYETYGYVFGQDAFECFVSRFTDDEGVLLIDTDGVVYKYLCLHEMRVRLLEILNGRDDELLHKIDVDMEKLKPDFVKTVKELGIEEFLPDNLLGLVMTEEEIAEYKKRREAVRKEFEERMKKMKEATPKHRDIDDEGLPF